MGDQEVELLREQNNFLREKVFEVFEMFCDIRDEFDGSEYQQGKKDGMRLALSILQPGSHWVDFNRGKGMARE